MESKTPTFTEKTTITAQAMNTLCIEDVLAALSLFLRHPRRCCRDFALTCDRNGTSFWLIREAEDAITVCLQSER